MHDNQIMPVDLWLFYLREFGSASSPEYWPEPVGTKDIQRNWMHVSRKSILSHLALVQEFKGTL